MEEYIGYGLVILTFSTAIFLFKKLFKRNNSSLGNGDEIILDSDMVHYGPFSGSACQQHSRKFVFLLAISSSFLALTRTAPSTIGELAHLAVMH